MLKFPVQPISILKILFLTLINIIHKKYYGFHPRSAGLMYNIPALDTVAGVAVLKWEISNNSLMPDVRAIRSFEARVNTCSKQCHKISKKF